MKDLKPQQVEEVAGGLEPRQYDNQVAPEPTGDPNVIDYNPDRTPK
jgi:hypothetical protein